MTKETTVLAPSCGQNMQTPKGATGTSLDNINDLLMVARHKKGHIRENQEQY